MTDFRTYQDPGVYVDVIPYPTLATAAVSPTVIAVIGDSLKYSTFSEVIQLNGTTNVRLTKTGIDDTSLVVRNRLTGVAYVITDDYVVTETDPSTPSDPTDDTIDVKRATSGSDIVDGEWVLVTYEYTDTGYYDATKFTSYDMLQEKYGAPFDSTGAVQSELSLGGLLAFSNGATEVWGVAVASNDYAGFKTAIDALVNEERINVIVPMHGTAPAGTPATNVIDYLKQHCDAMALNGVYRRAFVGLDVTELASDLETAAILLASERMSLVGPSKITIDTGASAAASRFQDVPGYYLAAAVAGSAASRSAHVPLTHKLVGGFETIPDQESRATVLEMQRAGVLVVFERRDGQLMIKHGLTTKTSPAVSGSSIYSQEVSVVAARDRLRDLIEDTLESSDVVGSVLTTVTPELVGSVVGGALEVATTYGLINGYANLAVRVPSDTPTVVEVRFAYQPALPLNYVTVLFALDVQSGQITFTEGGAI